MRILTWYTIALLGVVLAFSGSFGNDDASLSQEKYTEVAFNATCDRERDSLALVNLYVSTNGPIWTNKWDLDAPMASWYGVQFNTEGCVRSIRLNNNQLQGNLPPEIGNLEQLEELWLQVNFLIGPFPDTITNCRMLKDLRLFNNSLSGTLPEDLGNLDSLRFLNCARNVIRGPLPASIGNCDSLNYLSFGNNRLTGTIPASIGNLTELTLLDLSQNRFEGPIPEGISNMTDLLELYLFQNDLSGEIPQGFSGLTRCDRMWLYANNLTGAVPDLNNLPLISLRLEFNQLEDLPDLTGINTFGIAFPNGLTVHHNKLTFEDIIPNLALQIALFEYVPQDSIGEPDTVYLFEGDDFIWDLGIDTGITDNNYKFFRNDTVVRFQNSGELFIPNLNMGNAGVYTVEVNNFNVPDLLLYSHPLTLVVQDTSDCGNPAPGASCTTTPRLCDARDINGYCGTLPDSLNLSTPRPLCGAFGIPENAHWISFIASDSTMAIRVIPSSCEGDTTNNMRIAGMQAAIYDNCNLNNAVACSGECREDPFTLESDEFIPGAVYYMILDGCAADVCDYRLEVIRGNSKFELPEPDTIFSESIVCLGDSSNYFLIDTSEFTTSYVWTTSTGDTLQTFSSVLRYGWHGSGTFELCVAALNSCDTTNYHCQNFEVAPRLQADTSSVFCVEDKSGYRVIIDLEGGVPPYAVVEGEGTINAGSNRFLSDTLPNESTFTYVFTDAIGCTFDTTIYFNCICESEAGLMDQTPLELCALDTAYAVSLGGTFLEADDDSLYIMHTLPGDELGTLLLASKTGVFTFDSTELELGTTYYISLVVGNSNMSNGVIFNDLCLSVAPGQPVTFYENAFADAGTGTLECDLDALLEANLPYGSGEWQIGSGPGQVLITDPGSPATQVEVSKPGNYNFYWHVTVGSCEALDSVSVFFNEAPPLTIGGDMILCQGSTAELVAEGNFISFEWSSGETTRFITIEEHGRYCVTATDEANCTREACVDVQLSPRPRPMVEGPMAICQNGSATLSVSEEFISYEWNTGDLTRDIEVDQAGAYCVTVTDELGCRGTGCLAIGLLPNGETQLRDTICFGEEYVNGAIRASESGSYRFTYGGAAANGCDSVVTLDLLVLESIHIIDTIVQPDLGNNTGVLSIRVSGGLPPYDIRWNNGQTGNTIVGLSAGPYTATITDAKGCIMIFILNVPSGTSTEAFSRYITDWKVIPNPVETGNVWTVTWESAQAGKTQLSLLDVTGRVIWRENRDYGQGANRIQIAPEVIPGQYWLVWNGKDGLRSSLPILVK